MNDPVRKISFTSSNPRVRLLSRAALIVLLASSSLWPQATKRPSVNASVAAGEFYIISSVDLAKKELLLKRPTEVTELIRVDDRTAYRDQNSKAIKLTDLRAGDTVYITTTTAKDQPSPQSQAATSVAAVIAKGPMTVGELNRRYLHNSQ